MVKIGEPVAERRAAGGLPECLFNTPSEGPLAAAPVNRHFYWDSVTLIYIWNREGEMPPDVVGLSRLGGPREAAPEAAGGILQPAAKIRTLATMGRHTDKVAGAETGARSGARLIRYAGCLDGTRAKNGGLSSWRPGRTVFSDLSARAALLDRVTGRNWVERWHRFEVRDEI